MPRLAAVLLALLSVVVGCGNSSKHTSPPPPPSTATQSSTIASTTAPKQTGPGALQAEANSAAAGDIPDNQVFLVFSNARDGYSIKYPEGWARRAAGTTVVFRDKNNIVRIAVGRAASPTPATVARDLSQLPGARIVLSPRRTTLAGKPAIKVVYSTVSAPNAVTGKRVTLVVDRYYLARGGRRAVVDLGTPRGVDNVDAYRLMIQSFRWR
jgi:hypothetical protein